MGPGNYTTTMEIPPALLCNPIKLTETVTDIEKKKVGGGRGWHGKASHELAEKRPQ